MAATRLPLALLAVAALVAAALALPGADTPPPLRIGAVHALSGVMAGSERGLVDALHMAVDEINGTGGLLGRKVELVIADSASDWSQAAAGAEHLITAEGVEALFGCWTSSCRKALLPVVERHHHVLFYPLQYEGLENSSHIVYMGAAPNQQIIPGARWAFERFGPRIYLLGSDYVFPRTANQLVRDLLDAAGGTVAGERYLPLQASAADVDAAVAEIRRLSPDVVLNTINGEANVHLFAALARHGALDVPVLSFSLGEPELLQLRELPYHPRHHAVWNYFQSVPGRANATFVESFRARYGAERVVSDPMRSSYDAVRLWAAAVRAQGGAEPRRVLSAIGRVSVDGADGVVILDAATRHLWRRVYVGHARRDGQFDIEELSATPVRPAPFPPYRSREEWLHLGEHGGAPR